MVHNPRSMSNVKFNVVASSLKWRQTWRRSPVSIGLLIWAVSIVLSPSFPLDLPRIWAAEVTDRIVAIVNKDIITMSDLQAEIDDERKRLRARYSGEELNRRLAQKEYDVLNTLIERKLQLQEAEVKGITVTDEEVKKALQQITMEKMATPFAGSKLKKQVRERLILDRLWDFEIRRIVMVTDSEITQYYQVHIDDYLVSPAYRLRQILFLVRPGQNEGERRSRADMVYLALKTNGDFAELAGKYSDGPEASEGGVLGVVRKDELLTPIAQALETMQPGDISKPIKTRLGFHIIALDEVKPPQARALEEVENDIRTFLYKKRAEEAFQHWLGELKKKAYIEIKF